MAHLPMNTPPRRGRSYLAWLVRHRSTNCERSFIRNSPGGSGLKLRARRPATNGSRLTSGSSCTPPTHDLPLPPTSPGTPTHLAGSWETTFIRRAGAAPALCSPGYTPSTADHGNDHPGEPGDTRETCPLEGQSAGNVR